jgi:hypothetical protein
MHVDWNTAAAYCDEGYAIVSVDQLNGQGDTPEGLDIDQLNSDLQAVTT